MSTPFQIVLRNLGFFTVYKTAEEFLKAEEEAKDDEREALWTEMETGRKP